MSNPFKVGDKVRHRNAGDSAPVREVLAVHGESLWVQFPSDPVTAKAEHYVKAEEPIVAGQLWKRGRPTAYTAIVEVTPRFVIYSTSDSDTYGVMKSEEFRRRYHR